MCKNVLDASGIKKLLALLDEHYEDNKSMLHFKTPFQLLIATILSAQCTDERVNKVTEELFKEFPKVEDYCALTPEELLPWIKSCGLAPAKSKYIVSCAKILRDQFDGVVPKSMDKLVSLPGVGRKTANVVLYNAFDIPGIAVDTHVYRVANRIGICDENSVFQTEMCLREKLPSEIWGKVHHQLIAHGRLICKARKPDCQVCFLNKICLFHSMEEKK